MQRQKTAATVVCCLQPQGSQSSSAPCVARAPALVLTDVCSCVRQSTFWSADDEASRVGPAPRGSILLIAPPLLTFGTSGQGIVIATSPALILIFAARCRCGYAALQSEPSAFLPHGGQGLHLCSTRDAHCIGIIGLGGWAVLLCTLLGLRLYARWHAHLHVCDRGGSSSGYSQESQAQQWSSLS